MVQTRFEKPDCGDSKSDYNISCYSEPNKSFIDYTNLTRTRCGYLLSSISVEALNTTVVSLDVQVLQLGWWLEGTCWELKCSKEANCTEFVSPFNGRQGFRCQCNEGFVGDGYRDGAGCRKASSDCNASNYITGKCGGTTRFGALVGGVAAGAFIMISVGLICCFIRRRSTLRAQNITRRRLTEATGSCSIPSYPYKEIEKATNCFSEKQRLGTGAYGTVYSGKLNNSDWVAIKRIKHRDTESIDQVMNEIKLLSSVSHPNLVRLLGCSIENGEQILVYEFMPNGTLSQHLQRIRGDGLVWLVRLTIATETAQAIAHLHSAINPPIYHRDIKSSNILLDFDYKSKVADFGLSRLGMIESSHISTAPQGTPGYLDPQYHQNFHLSDKSDVYSFGVVLAEIITALRVVDFSRIQNEINLANLAVDRISKGCLDEIIDPFLDKDDCTVSSINKVAELAFRCLAFHQDMRPTMMEVAVELEQIRVSFINNCNASSDSPGSRVSDKSLSLTVKKVGPETSMERMKDNSPVSVQDPWLSEHGSSPPSSNSLLSNAFQ